MIGKFEANKDLIQELTSSGARRVGNIAGIITGTVAEVTREIGEWITDAIEMNEAAAAARRDAAATAGRDDADGPDGTVGHAADPGPAAPDTTVTPLVGEVVDADVVEPDAAGSDTPGKRL
ncbi:hypothetical protein [Nocardia carnea]|uniref:hypothetical protein n=1 Tax=Nocardia carnea TaxID=37328 RepID=UPI0024568145|nr:hypothetical protein [Nocardia carnea]